jgi:hypothetical protein
MAGSFAKATVTLCLSVAGASYPLAMDRDGWHKEAPHRFLRAVGKANLTSRRVVTLNRVWSFCLRVARSAWARLVVLILLMIFQMVALWLLGQMVDLCISLMELWVELATKHLELTL